MLVRTRKADVHRASRAIRRLLAVGASLLTSQFSVTLQSVPSMISRDAGNMGQSASDDFEQLKDCRDVKHDKSIGTRCTKNILVRVRCCKLLNRPKNVT